MKFFIDTANLDQIREAQDLGILDGVTTNPSLMAKEGISGHKNIINHYLKICDIVDGDVSAEVISTDFKGIVKEGEYLASLNKQIVVKVPMVSEGVKAIKYFADKNRAEEAYQILKTSINMDNNTSSVQAVYAYMKVTIHLQKKGIKSKKDLLSTYSIVSEIVDYNIKNESKTTKNFIKYSEKIEDMFTPYANCEDIISLYTEKFQTSKEDIDLLKRIEKILTEKECVKNQLYLDLLSILKDLDESYDYQIKLASALFANGYFLKSSNI